jgi:hypothetical protein
MTDQPKRGRGRPRKIDSFQQLKKDFDAAQLPEAEIIQMAEAAKNYQGPAMAVTSEIPQPGNWKNDFEKKGFAVTPNKGILVVDADKFKSYPPDWDKMGKVDKLAWLTANPR